MWKLWEKRPLGQWIRKIGIISSLIFMATLQAAGEQAAQLGRVYPILEPDWREWIPKQLEKKLAHDPEWWKKKLEAAFQRQTPQWDLPEVSVPSSRVLDPSVTVRKPVFDRSGRLKFLPVKVNPIDMVPLSRPILVLDGRKERQVDLAKRLPKQPIVILITAGDPVLLKRVLGQPVYSAPKEVFKKLEIERVPVLIRQENGKIKVEEIAQ